MKNKLLYAYLIVLVSLTIGSSANALNLSYEYLGVTYGSMDISIFDSDSLQVEYNANSPLPLTAEVTGFAFTFNPSTTTPDGVSNPTAALNGDDRDDLDWIVLNNLNAIPNPANSSLSKTDFLFGVTEGNANNFSPDGILAGETDRFYFDFYSAHGLTSADLDEFVLYTGIRIQSLPNDINGGSLFLTDTTTPVPEPATMLLLGTGLVGLAGFGRRKFRNK